MEKLSKVTLHWPPALRNAGPAKSPTANMLLTWAFVTARQNGCRPRGCGGWLEREGLSWTTFFKKVDMARSSARACMRRLVFAEASHTSDAQAIEAAAERTAWARCSGLPSSQCPSLQRLDWRCSERRQRPTFRCKFCH